MKLRYMALVALIPLSVMSMKQSDDHDSAISSDLSDALIGKEVLVNFLNHQTDNDFYDGQLVIYQGYDVLAENELAKPRYGRIKNDPYDSRLTFFKTHQLNYYKILACKPTINGKTQDFYTYIRKDHISALAIQSSSACNEAH